MPWRTARHAGRKTPARAAASSARTAGVATLGPWPAQIARPAGGRSVHATPGARPPPPAPAPPARTQVFAVPLPPRVCAEASERDKFIASESHQQNLDIIKHLDRCEKQIEQLRKTEKDIVAGLPSRASFADSYSVQRLLLQRDIFRRRRRTTLTRLFVCFAARPVALTVSLCGRVLPQEYEGRPTGSFGWGWGGENVRARVWGILTRDGEPLAWSQRCMAWHLRG